MNHCARFGTASIPGYVPSKSGSRNEHFTCRCACLSQRDKCRRAASTTARTQADSFETHSGHGLLQIDLRELDFQFLSQRCRKICSYALTHFGTRNPQRDGVVPTDTNICIRLESRGL